MNAANMEFRFESGPTVVTPNGTELARVIRINGAYSAVTPDGRTICNGQTLTACWIAASKHFGGEDDEPADDFRQSDKPSLAALHRRWLDRGLPSRTWVDFAQSGALANYR